ncbi:CpaF family protein [Pusillimonas sp.]|uniref:CpaF family protein n=1 Tax=Pusillimonas sp. TaxID=3040095 RepID=UPI0037CC3B6F
MSFGRRTDGRLADTRREPILPPSNGGLKAGESVFQTGSGQGPDAPVASMTGAPAQSVMSPPKQVDQAEKKPQLSPTDDVVAPASVRGSEGVSSRRAHKAPETVVRSQHYSAIRQSVFSTIDVSSALNRSRDQVRAEVETIIAETVQADSLPVTQSEQRLMAREILHDMFGVGPIEPLLQDETVSDIMVNGPDQVYVERHGRLELTALKFRDNAHVTNVAQRIASSIGRRVDESSPMVDARLPDGSRVNVVLPPLAIDGASISIRKFSRKDLTLPRLAARGSLSPAMARVLEIAAASRLNVIISGGTGSGKTTLLNALSRYISETERVVTIEDAAELQLQQPHVVRLETRPASIEGSGAVNQGDLVRNALRMRPDRIILGETRGAEAFDVLQAMNTGHDGSMTTLHANNPRDALTRLESMVMMANGNLPLFSIRRQIASAVHLIVQVERMRDGSRRVTSIVELAGMEGEIIVTQELFQFHYDATAYGDEVKGSYDSTGMRPLFAERAAYFGMKAPLIEAMQP